MIPLSLHKRFFKTRLAPTPSGYLHAGNAFNFLMIAAAAKQLGANLLLRIDDLDRERYRTNYARDIFDTLRFLHIQWQEGPKSIDDFEERWSQRRRLHLYNEALQKLRDGNKIFACACSRRQTNNCRCREKALSLDMPGTSWRLITTDQLIIVQNMDGTITTTPLPAVMQDFIVRKKNGLPAYQLCSMVDDLHFGVDLIIRGEDLWPSTLAQQFLATQLGEESFSSIAFYRHPLLKNTAGEKLSKSAGASSLKQWRESGKSATDFFEYLSESLVTQGMGIFCSVLQGHEKSGL